MSIKKTLLAAVVAAFAFAALPGLAVADEVDYEEAHFTVAGGHAELESEAGNITCAEVTGTGEFTESSPAKTGTIELTFHGCKAFGTNCQSAGQPTGTITTTEELQFHVVRLTDGDVDKPGVLITPNTIDTTEGEEETKHHTHFATFKCAGGLVTVRVRGNGVIGEITEGYGKQLSTYEIDFATNAAGTAQKYLHYFDAHTKGEGGAEEHTTRGPYTLESSLNGGAFQKAVQVGEGKMHFTNNKKAEITTTHTE